MNKKNLHNSVTLLIGTIILFNVLYAVIYKGLEVAMFVGFSLICFLAIFFSARVKGYKAIFFQEHELSKKEMILRFFLFVSPFTIPLLMYGFDATMLHGHFNVVLRISFGWIIFSLLWLNFIKEDTNDVLKDVLAPFLLFFLWTVIFWLSVTWDVGAKDLFVKAVSSPTLIKNDRFASIIFPIWENTPFKEHFGLAFLNYDNFQESAYAHHYQFYLFIHYAIVKLIQIITGCQMWIATRLVSFFYCGVLIFSTAFYAIKTRFQIKIKTVIHQMIFFLGIGFLLSLPDFWITLLRYNTDNIMPWVAYITLMLFAYVKKDDYFSKGFIFLMIFYSLLFPIYALIALLALCFFGLYSRTVYEDPKQRKRFACIVLFVFVLIIAAFFYPKIAVKILGYKNVGSSLLFRSGLDGDMTYYQNLWQAIVYPYGKSFIRQWSAIIPAIIFAFCAFILSGAYKKRGESSVMPNCVFLFSPYLFSLVFFPQAVSIHPYWVDYLFLFPLAFLGVYWTFSMDFKSKNRAALAFLFFLLLTSLVMFNLTSISQAARYIKF